MKILFNILLYRFLFETVFWLSFPITWTYLLVMDIIRWRRPWPWGKLRLVRAEVIRKFRP